MEVREDQKQHTMLHGQHLGLDKSKQQRDLCLDRKLRRMESSSPEGSAGGQHFNKRCWIVVEAVVVMRRENVRFIGMIDGKHSIGRWREKMSPPPPSLSSLPTSISINIVILFSISDFILWLLCIITVNVTITVNIINIIITIVLIISSVTIVITIVNNIINISATLT